MKPLPVLLCRVVQQWVSILFYGNKTIYHQLHWKNGAADMIIIMQEITAIKDGISQNYKELKLCENLALNAVIINSLVLEILKLIRGFQPITHFSFWQGYSLQPACLQAGRSIIHPLCGVHKRIFAAIPQPVDR